MTTRLRLATAAFLTDMALYLLMLSLPYRLLDQGASSAVIGLVPLLLSGPYGLMALRAGRASDRLPRRGPIRRGLVVTIVATLVLGFVRGVPPVLALVPLVGIGLGFFWPSLQAGFSEISGGRDLHRLTGLFNVSWSTGKGIGLIAGGMLVEWLGPPGVAFFAAGAFVLSALVLPSMPRPGDHSEALAEDGRVPTPDEQRAFRRAAWIANGLAFAVGSTITHHLPKVLLTHDIGAGDFGLFFGTVFFAQTAMFVLTGPRREWHFRATPLLVLQVLLALTVVAVSFVDVMWALLAFAPLLGSALGFAYQSSLYYSLHAPVDRGAQAGVHEAVLGLASAGLPVLGGLLVGVLGVRAPFVLAALAVATSATLGAIWIIRARRRRGH